MKSLKRGELILLWVAGLWTVLALLLAANAVGPVSRRLLEALVFSAAGWIICGVIWVTYYGREK